LNTSDSRSLNAIHSENASVMSSLRLVMVLSGLLLLSACASKNTNSVDNSADYKSAVSLPPLKKPSRTRPVVSEPEPAAPILAAEPPTPAPKPASTDDAYIPEAIQIEPESEPLADAEPIADTEPRAVS